MVLKLLHIKFCTHQWTATYINRLSKVGIYSADFQWTQFLTPKYDLWSSAPQLHVANTDTNTQIRHTLHTDTHRHLHTRKTHSRCTHTYTHIDIHSSYMTLIGVHEMHGRVHPS